MNIILIFPEELDGENCARLSGPRAKHIVSVLRAKAGKTLRVGLLNGPLGQATVLSVTPGDVALSCAWNEQLPPRPAIDLLLAMPRPKVLKRLWAQIAALGVGRIFIANATKVERYYFDTHVLRPEFYTARLIEGLQQARDTRLPDVQIIKKLKPFLEMDPFGESDERLFADPSGSFGLIQAVGLADGAVDPEGSSARRCCLAIGPEGGWVPREVALFQRHGFTVFNMGSRILRTDTACVGLLSMLAEVKRTGI